MRRAVEAATERGAFKPLARLTDQLRFQGGWNYDQTLALATLATGIDEADWDMLMHEIDELASYEAL